MTDPAFACRFAALSIALRAKSKPLWRSEVERLVALAQPLAEGDGLRRQVTAFAATWAMDRWDVAAMDKAADGLMRAVERSSWPDAIPQGAA